MSAPHFHQGQVTWARPLPHLGLLAWRSILRSCDSESAQVATGQGAAQAPPARTSPGAPCRDHPRVPSGLNGIMPSVLLRSPRELLLAGHPLPPPLRRLRKLQIGSREKRGLHRCQPSLKRLSGVAKENNSSGSISKGAADSALSVTEESGGDTPSPFPRRTKSGRGDRTFRPVS